MRFMAILLTSLLFLHAEAATNSGTSEVVSRTGCAETLEPSADRDLVSLGNDVPKIVFVVAPASLGQSSMSKDHGGPISAKGEGNESVSYLDMSTFGDQDWRTSGARLYLEAQTDAQVLVLNQVPLKALNSSGLDELLIGRLLAEPGKTTFIIPKDVGDSNVQHRISVMLASKVEVMKLQMPFAIPRSSSGFEILLRPL